jgi:hypothetical protein
MNISGNVSDYFLLRGEQREKIEKKLPFGVTITVAEGIPDTSVKPTQSAAQAKEVAAKDANAKNEETIAEFMAYAKKTSAEKLQEAWLARHGISKKEFDAMSAEEKQKILTQMKSDIEREAKLAIERLHCPVNVLV